ncbi:DUF4126 domain-containing protein [Segeticoccus rhizosphaerae]|jgi:hypothetical protein|uniref:DUF4126 domain-containing protein n=1 Tax=Segeticoccus rhizosphaerae TaxID=1104777 RepID=UPI0012645398|nr:DUF4126 domain-containing protein [Segeticoccus rhizosphaerae]
MLAALTGMGLSAAAGLNAYIPFLMVALLARFTDVIALPQSYAWIESTWAIGVAAVLLLTEVVLDKIAIVDSLNDAVATFIRPTVGGLIFAATSAAGKVDSSSWMQDHPWVGVVLGVAISGIVHATKATTRPAVNISTVGLGAPVVSAAEDTTSVGLSLIAVFLPVLVIVALVLLAWVMWWAWRQFRRMKRRRPGRSPSPA